MKPSPHQDAADLAAELRNGANVSGVGPRVANLAAEFIEQQAKALSEAEVCSCVDVVESVVVRALAAEARLTEAMKVIEPFADVVLPWGDIGSGMIDAKSVLAARSFLNSASNKEGAARAQQESSDA